LQVLIAHAFGPVVPRSRLRPGVPEDLERVVLRYLAKDPADRFSDAVALERVLAGCADAGTWDAEQAAPWWREVDPGATAE
jgi:serine/threonine-protein kinase